MEAADIPLCCTPQRHFAPNLSKAQPRSAPLAAVKPPPDGEESTGLSAPQIQQQQQQQQHHMSEEHKELLRQAELDALWARGGKKGPHSAAGRPKQPGFRVSRCSKLSLPPSCRELASHVQPAAFCT